ncbi:MAG: hypothetical protein AAF630_12025 [Cyanobacteria bacterium P01_C01_bin.38]
MRQAAKENLVGEGFNRRENYQCPMPNPQCPIPNSQSPIPNYQLPIPHSSNLEVNIC